MSDHIYRVKFIYLNQHDRANEEYDYDDIFEAITVARNSNIGTDRTHITAFTPSRFTELFPSLLKNGFVFTGRQTHENPDGSVMVFLLKVNPDTQTESPILPKGGEAIATPFSAYKQDIDTSIMKTEAIPESYIHMQYIEPKPQLDS